MTSVIKDAVEAAQAARALQDSRDSVSRAHFGGGPTTNGPAPHERQTRAVESAGGDESPPGSKTWGEGAGAGAGEGPPAKSSSGDAATAAMERWTMNKRYGEMWLSAGCEVEVCGHEEGLYGSWTTATVVELSDDFKAATVVYDELIEDGGASLVETTSIRHLRPPTPSLRDVQAGNASLHARLPEEEERAIAVAAFPELFGEAERAKLLGPAGEPRAQPSKAVPLSRAEQRDWAYTVGCAVDGLLDDLFWQGVVVKSSGRKACTVTWEATHETEDVPLKHLRPGLTWRDSTMTWHIRRSTLAIGETSPVVVSRKSRKQGNGKPQRNTVVSKRGRHRATGTRDELLSEDTSSGDERSAQSTRLSRERRPSRRTASKRLRTAAPEPSSSSSEEVLPSKTRRRGPRNASQRRTRPVRKSRAAARRSYAEVESDDDASLMQPVESSGVSSDDAHKDRKRSRRTADDEIIDGDGVDYGSDPEALSLRIAQEDRAVGDILGHRIAADAVLERPTGPKPQTSVKHLRRICFRYEYFVQWKDRSHWYDEWIDYMTLRVCAGDFRLANYARRWRNGAKNVLRPRLPVVRPEWSHVDCIVAERRAAPRGSKPTHGYVQVPHQAEFLTKWRGLPWEEATWEPAASLARFGDVKEVEDALKRYRYIQSGSRWKGRTRYDVPPGGFRKTPPFLRGTLYPHQLEGLNWLLQSHDSGRSVILGDEMGLGKTCQALSVCASLQERDPTGGPVLVVAPLSTLEGWTREAAAWAPDMVVIPYVGSQQGRDLLWEKVLRARGGSGRHMRAKFDVLVCNYEIVNKDSDRLKRFQWRALVVDEGHRLKRQANVVYRVLDSFNVPWRLLLTGTPMENSLIELFTLLNFISKKTFPNPAALAEQFSRLKRRAAIQELHRLVGPYLLRRLKSDVVLELPDLRDRAINLEATDVQKQFYRLIVAKNYSALNKGVATNMQTGLRNVIMELKKLCNHPYLIEGVEQKVLTSRNLHRAAASLTQWQNAEGVANDVVVSQGVYDTMVESCGKLALLDRLLRKLRERGHRVLIFSQMTRMLDILEDYLRGSNEFAPFPTVNGAAAASSGARGGAGGGTASASAAPAESGAATSTDGAANSRSTSPIKYGRIDGKSAKDDRQRVVDEFNAPSSELFCLLISTRAGGLGLNLTGADTVILYDPDWNPHMELQALARAHRIGSKKTVVVYRMVTRDTVEERIVSKARAKLVMGTLVVDKLSGVSQSEMKTILRHGLERMFDDGGDSEKKEGNAGIDDAELDKLLDRDSKDGDVSIARAEKTAAHDSAEDDDDDPGSVEELLAPFSKALTSTISAEAPASVSIPEGASVVRSQSETDFKIEESDGQWAANLMQQIRKVEEDAAQEKRMYMASHGKGKRERSKVNYAEFAQVEDELESRTGKSAAGKARRSQRKSADSSAEPGEEPEELSGPPPEFEKGARVTLMVMSKQVGVALGQLVGNIGTVVSCEPANEGAKAKVKFDGGGKAAIGTNLLQHTLPVEIANVDAGIMGPPKLKRDDIVHVLPFGRMKMGPLQPYLDRPAKVEAAPHGWASALLQFEDGASAYVAKQHLLRPADGTGPSTAQLTMVQQQGAGLRATERGEHIALSADGEGLRATDVVMFAYEASADANSAIGEYVGRLARVLPRESSEEATRIKIQFGDQVSAMVSPQCLIKINNEGDATRLVRSTKLFADGVVVKAAMRAAHIEFLAWQLRRGATMIKTGRWSSYVQATEPGAPGLFIINGLLQVVRTETGTGLRVESQSSSTAVEGIHTVQRDTRDEQHAADPAVSASEATEHPIRDAAPGELAKPAPEADVGVAASDEPSPHSVPVEAEAAGAPPTSEGERAGAETAVATHEAEQVSAVGQSSAEAVDQAAIDAAHEASRMEAARQLASFAAGI